MLCAPPGTSIPTDLPPLFDGLNDVDVQSALRRFERRNVKPGDVVAREGDAADSLLCVLAGELEIRRGDAVLATLKPPAILGETALFEKSTRNATVTARGESTLLTLSRDGYEELRDTMHPIAANLENTALRLQARHLVATGERVSSLARGTPMEPVPPTQRFRAAVGWVLGMGGLQPAPQGNPLSALRRSPLFASAPQEVLERIARAFASEYGPRGTFLCTQGEEADRMFVLDEGRIDVVVAAAGEKPQRIATLRPGAAFGMVGLAGGGARMSSCIANTAVVVHTLDRPRWLALVTEPYLTGSTFRRAIIHAFSQQLAYSNAQLAQFAADQEINGLRRANAGIDAHTTTITGMPRPPQEPPGV